MCTTEQQSNTDNNIEFNEKHILTFLMKVTVIEIKT